MATTASTAARLAGLAFLGAQGLSCLQARLPTAGSAASDVAAPEAPLAAGPGATTGSAAPEPAAGISETLEQAHFRLLEEQDTDCDQKITRQDQGSRRFRFQLSDQPYELTGSYVLSNLLQELTLAIRSQSPPRLDRVTEDPIKRTARLIRDEYWTRLTRSVDEEGIVRVLEDEKVAQQPVRSLYVPSDDARALEYFAAVQKRYNPAYARLTEGIAGLPFRDLVQTSDEDDRVLVAMLRTTEGRRDLHEFAERLSAIAAGIEYPALTQRLELSLERIHSLLGQAERSCVHLSTLRLGRVAQRAARELQSFSAREMRAQALPPRAQWPGWVRSLGNAHGPLSLALMDDPERGLVGVPFVVPGGRFNEMYGWDSYFIVLGLIADQRLDLASSLVDNFTYAITHYGATLNANRTYYLTRSQPPLFTSMIRAVWEATPAEDRDKAWLRRSLQAARREYTEVWAGNRHAIGSLCLQRPSDHAERSEREGDPVCLARYAGQGKGQPPEVETGHFNWLWQDVGRSLEASYAAGTLGQRQLERELDDAFRHDRCMRESGHDTTYRWFQTTEHPAGGARATNRCADMATVDLNSLLYKYEIDIAHLLGELSETGSPPPTAAPPKAAKPVRSKHGVDDTPHGWCERASQRFALMKKHLWSSQDGLFYDALVTPSGTQQTGYVSATTLYPLWATAGPPGPCAAAPLSEEERSALVTNALGQLEAAGGLLSTARASRDRYSDRADRQWDYPNGWAPHQMLAWRGLSAHGFEEDAQRLAFSWLFTLLSNVVDFNGTIVEKYDVVERTHAVFSEYGNVGTEFDYIAGEGFGWVNASFQVGLSVLSPKERRRLGQSITRR